jgi:hypothetical protein
MIEAVLACLVASKQVFPTGPKFPGLSEPHRKTKSERIRAACAEAADREEESMFTRKAEGILRTTLAACVLLSASNTVAEKKGHCVPVGGAFLTNLGGFGDNTTLGVATGDLKGALGVQIVGQGSGPNGAVIVSVEHHWVTESGDAVFVDKADATGVFVAPGLLAFTNYPTHISGGTGKFKGATGDMTSIGEVDFNSGQAIGRYSGQICYGK